jgi:hypothetical protein
MKRKMLVVLAILAVACWAGTAGATTFGFTSFLNTPNSDLSASGANVGPYAEVGINLIDSTHASVTFLSLTNAGKIYLMGAVSAADLNVNATTFTVGTVTGTNAGTGFSPGPFTTNIAAGQNVDGQGLFNLTIDSFDGFTHSSDNISFTLTDTSGTWASAANVLAFNAAGNDAAAHILVTTSPANASNGASVTGFAGEHPVPIPPSALLLGSGLLGLVGFGWRKRS